MQVALLLVLYAVHGAIARNARLDLESKIGRSVVTGKNFLPRLKK